jgi:hypothetical protein
MLDGCVDWPKVNVRGYGYGTFGGVAMTAHRAAYIETYGPIPEELPEDGSRQWEVHHRCENKACVNPDHLVLLSAKQHKQIHYRTGYCKRGHALEGANLRITPQGYPQCKACHAWRQRRRYARLQEESTA